MSRAEDLVGQHNLPEDLSSLIGRERDLVEVSGLVDSHRVVTLVGVGGVGKTRLSLACARAAVQHFPDGIWLVELGSITEAGLVTVVVATSVGIAIRPRQPVTETLIAAVGTGRVLLVLDNCEHLVQACAELVERLVRACPRLHLLVTSREPLGLPGEIAWQVAPLATPVDALMPVEHLAEVDSVRLFVERAQAALPKFSLTSANAVAVAQVCRSRRATAGAGAR